ncbi:MAG TPA: AGE family epimerase/isomerase, partial [Ferruginibacter sp.]|nr:AGE family epimerase/isomerase [Ferruginibacter sp.]
PLKIKQEPATQEWSVAILKSIREQLMQTADFTWGGFGRAPKFPQTMSLRFLIAHAHLFPDPDIQAFAEKSVRALLESGIYDQLGGGLARYSTDVQWMAPHFEKMLYDNALLLRLLCDAQRAFPQPVYVDYIHRTLSFILAELRHPAGGFWSAIDADSEGVEGLYYTWSEAELQSAMGKDEQWILSYYGIREGGNWEGRNILHVSRTIESIQQETGLDETAIRLALKTVQEKWRHLRQLRVRPQTDDKILIGWNSLLLTAMLNCYWVTDTNEYLQEAIELYDFLRKNFFQGDRMCYHTYKDTASQPVFLDDLAYFTEACLALGQATGETKYFQTAASLLEQALETYWSEKDQLFLYTAAGQSDVIVRKAEFFDQALPSGNSVMAACLCQLGAIFEQPEWFRRAETMYANLLPMLVRYPGSFGHWIIGLVGLVIGQTELVITGPAAVAESNRIGKKLFPGLFWMPVTKQEHIPLASGKAVDNQLQYYVCRHFSCLPVTNDWQKVEALLKNHDELT